MEVGQYVWLSRKAYPNCYIKSHFSKFERSNLGPFRIISVDNSTNRVTLQITPSRSFETKVSFLKFFNGKLNRNGHEFTPFLDEIILLPIPSKVSIKERVIASKEKLKYDVRSIVGKRVNIKWSSNNKYYPATVIGYTTNQLFNLVHFDEPTIDRGSGLQVTPSEDYYKLKLFKTGDKSRVEKWDLLMTI